MEIFDCHYHIEENEDNYDIDVIGRNVIFNFIDDYNKHKYKLKNSDSVTLILDCFEKKNSYILYPKNIHASHICPPKRNKLFQQRK